MEMETMDMISGLPEHILHHILNLLHWPKDITRTSILSKKWKVIWDSFMSFDFDQRLIIQGQGVEKSSKYLQDVEIEEQRTIFKQFVDNTLATRLGHLPSIQKFRLHISSFDVKSMAPSMNRWLTAAIDKNVRELEIHVDSSSKYYIPPRVVFASKTITSLKLYGCRVDSSYAIKIQNLRVLSIKMANISESIVHNFVQGCPLIEDMRLVYCSGLKCLNVSTLSKLKRFEVHGCSSLSKIELEAPNLETFWFHGKKSVSCEINLAGCENLKNLTLKDARMKDESFHEHVACFPVLEKLVLIECHALQRITILSDKLKKLALIRCQKLKEFNVDAPNLLSFEYTGDELPFSSMTVSRLQEVKLHLKTHLYKPYPFEVQKFLEGFYSKGFMVFLATKQDVSIHEELRGIHLLASGMCKIELTKSLRNVVNLLNSHLRDFHPNTLFLASSPSSDLVMLIKEMIMNREKTPSCCTYYSKKCWRHCLHDVEMSDYSNDSPVIHNTSFKLKWESQDIEMDD